MAEMHYLPVHMVDKYGQCFFKNAGRSATIVTKRYNLVVLTKDFLRWQEPQLDITQ